MYAYDSLRTGMTSVIYYNIPQPRVLLPMQLQGVSLSVCNYLPMQLSLLDTKIAPLNTVY